MVKLRIVLLDKHLDALTSALGRAAFVHLTSAVSESDAGLLSKVDHEAEIRAREAELAVCRQIKDKLALPDGAASSAAAGPPGGLAEVSEAIARESDELDKLAAEAMVLRNRETILSCFPLRGIRFSALRNLKHLFVGIGRLPQAAIDDVVRELGEIALLQAEPAGSDDKTVTLVVVALRRHRFQIESLLNKTGFLYTDIPAELAGTADEELAATRERLDRLGEQARGRRETILELGRLHGAFVLREFNSLNNRLAELRAQEQFGKSRRVLCLSGWIPADRETEARRVAADVTEGAAVVSSTPAEQDRRAGEGRDKIPVKFVPNALLKPFQGLVSAYGTPRYEEVEPSLFVAVSFVLMFGIMFGDVGHGALLTLAGLYLMLSRGPRVKAIRIAGPFLLFCGISAVLFGFAYGSLFGREDMLPSFWLRPMENATTLFVYAVGLGIACISFALALNLVNRFRARDWLNGFLDKAGLAGVLLYWGVLALGLVAALGGAVKGWQMALFVLVPVLFLFLREPLHYFLEIKHGHAAKGGLSIALLTAFVETADAFSSFLGNTVSFVRVGAFALSHAALCLAVYAIADLLRPGPGGRWISLLFIVVGNLFVLAMEGMLVLIQITRLQFYELFAKYFNGDGIAYAPFQLDTHIIQGESRA